MKELEELIISQGRVCPGNALKGLIDICNQAKAKVEGIGICIEKGFQSGESEIRSMGYDIMSLATIESMSEDGKITFKEED